MSKAIRIVKLLFILLMIALYTSCAPAKKNPYYQKKNKASRVNTEQLGRNRYYFSPAYQKKLGNSFKKK